ncbi:MAG: hypothetical protein IJT73_06485 [Selenomonadaceae bacterium]|nr:hypothetical protein [Selenomonadaceae bacterium]
MALQWATSPTMTIKFNVATNANGNIATGSDTAAGNKTVSLQGVKSDATYAQAKTVYDAILNGICGATYDSQTAVRVITSGVVDDGE